VTDVRDKRLVRILEWNGQGRLPLVAAVDFHDQIGSTSDRALELAARDDAALPLLVLAERQTAGRGRGTNRWWTAEGALTFSLALAAPADRLPPFRWPQVALATGLAVCDALQPLVPAADLRVKWPNDVFLGGQKLCGILCESVPGWGDRLVVGVGVNVNSSFRSQEPGARSQEPGDTGRHELRRSAVALIDQDGVERDLANVLVAILDQFERRWSELLEEGFAAMAAEYRQRCFLSGRTVTVEQPGGKRIVGLARGIGDDGALLLATETGPMRVVAGSVAAWEPM
jgi:BirA family transcriptional regulator, biotin operon repressor / biotin---[acetyl-CoA-carboxylase] ligase